MNEILTILTQREAFLLAMCTVTYLALFVVAVQNSRRKLLALQERLNKVRERQESQDIENNLKKIAELESLLKKMGDENSLLHLELEEKKAKLDYANSVAKLENAKREQAETLVFKSDIYIKLKTMSAMGQSMNDQDWRQLEQVVNAAFGNFTEQLYGLYRMSTQDYRVSLLIKVRFQPKEIASLTAHSKESVASTRSRLYMKVFGKKGSSKDWDDFIFSL